ncbi:uncharacterized protein LOC120325425 isoform X1 [Styela clava]
MGNLPAVLTQRPFGMEGETTNWETSTANATDSTPEVRDQSPETERPQYWNIILPLVGIITLSLIILTTVFLRKYKKRHESLSSNSSQNGSNQGHSNPTFQMETQQENISSSLYISNADIASMPNRSTQPNIRNEVPISSNSQQLETVRIFNEWPRGTAPYFPFTNDKMGNNAESEKLNRVVSTVSGPYEAPMKFETPKGYLTFEVCSGMQTLVMRESSDQCAIKNHNLYLNQSTSFEQKIIQSKRESSTYTAMNMLNKITPQRHHPYHQIEENVQGKKKIKFSKLRSSKSSLYISMKGPVTQRQPSDPAKHIYEQMKIRSLSNRAAAMTIVATTREALIGLLKNKKAKLKTFFRLRMIF